MKPSSSNDSAHCPLCGGANACARAADPNASHCWCSEVDFPPTLLERVPAAAKNRCCICADCARQAAELATRIEP